MRYTICDCPVCTFLVACVADLVALGALDEANALAGQVTLVPVSGTYASVFAATDVDGYYDSPEIN